MRSAWKTDFHAKSARGSNKGQPTESMMEHSDMLNVCNIVICKATQKISVSEIHGYIDFVASAMENILLRECGLCSSALLFSYRCIATPYHQFLLKCPNSDLLILKKI